MKKVLGRKNVLGHVGFSWVRFNGSLESLFPLSKAFPETCVKNVNSFEAIAKCWGATKNGPRQQNPGFVLL